MYENTAKGTDQYFKDMYAAGAEVKAARDNLFQLKHLLSVAQSHLSYAEGKVILAGERKPSVSEAKKEIEQASKAVQQGEGVLQKAQEKYKAIRAASPVSGTSHR